MVGEGCTVGVQLVIGRAMKSETLMGAGYAVRMEEMRNVYRILVGAHGKGEVPRFGCVWDDKVGVREIGIRMVIGFIWFWPRTSDRLL
jgi:hypothetical protein